MKVAVSEMTDKVRAGVLKLGYTDEAADIIVDVLMYAQLRGNNQGITKIATGGVPPANKVEPYKVVKRHKCAAQVSGGHSMVASVRAAKLACELAAAHGVGIVGSNHTFSSSGAIGYFSRLIAESGYIGLVCVGTIPFVAPTGSAQAVLGTNPLSYAFPVTAGAVVFDTTTAAMAFFGVVEAKLKGEALPAGVAYDAEGVPTTDAARALDGSVATFAEHKGYGLSLLVQLLGGPFVGAGYAGLHAASGSGTFVLAIDPALLVNKDIYLETADELVGAVTQAAPLPGQGVLLPGERGDSRAAAARAADSIEVADAIWEELVAFSA